ncbi:hypothetical protein F5878DRAFT_641934 [Lentinula raphanica]|uniref:Uncharacterized protein n=1 Tax=Lentinula raphanica TaxID=153919 RepID=A0AA38P8Y7_9AGAR|nr:hypothetical protein C8R42DRAFT_642904 [Lentinula raphanica]KAJ3838503.1 hypothetical protein F5878DRAFT_641934 [Lentinula raphanica]
MPIYTSRRRRLSPSLSLLPGYLFNGKKSPEARNRIAGKTFGLYFPFGSTRPENVQFPSENSKKTSPVNQRHQRNILFVQAFSPDFQPDNLFTTLVIVEGRRYVVSGTYNQCLDGFNKAVKGIGCNEVYKGDIGICFLGKNQRERFLEGLPRFADAAEKRRILRKVIKRLLDAFYPSFTRNVINHVERHRRLSHIIRG